MKCRKYARLFGVLLAFALSMYCLNKIYHNHMHRVWIIEREDIILEFRRKHQLHRKEAGTDAPACVIPNLDPFSNDVIDFMEHTSENCTVNVYGDIVDGVYILKGHQFTDVGVQYIRRSRKSGEMTDDFAVSYSDRIPLQKDANGVYKLELREDHIKVSMFVWGHRYHYELHSHVAKTKDRLEKVKKLSDLKSGIPMNIVFFMFDSQSRANIQRQNIKTMKYLQQDEDSVILEGHSIVGDGTTAQLSAILTGVPEKDQPESRRNFPDTAPIDRFNWIFKELHKAGYITALGEDDTKYGSFYYRLNGFLHQPTTWYLRPFWMVHNQLFGTDWHPLCGAQRMMGFSKQFAKAFPDEAKFSLFAVAELCHNMWNNMQLVDEPILDLIKFFKETQNTMLILFGDHGPRTGGFRNSLQGKMEERLPFFSITLPQFFKSKYPEFYKSLKENQHVLTSHFDVYATLRHILSYPNAPPKTPIGQSLFTDIDPKTRTCASAGVEEHWCPCLDYTTVNPTEKDVQEVATAVIDYINKHLSLTLKKKHKLCATLKLKKVVNAGVRSPKKIVQKFAKTARNEKCDSCKVILDETVDTKTSSLKSYELTFVTSPNDGTYEANAKREQDGTITVDPNISRTNLYGNQPKCIMDEFPHARKYCFCI